MKYNQANASLPVDWAQYDLYKSEPGHDLCLRGMVNILYEMLPFYLFHSDSEEPNLNDNIVNIKIPVKYESGLSFSA